MRTWLLTKEGRRTLVTHERTPWHPFAPRHFFLAGLAARFPSILHLICVGGHERTTQTAYVSLKSSLHPQASR